MQEIDPNVTPARLHKRLQPFPVLDRIIAFEGGELEDNEAIELFQYLVNTGQVWTLQGTYGRIATELLAAGAISAPELS